MNRMSLVLSIALVVVAGCSRGLSSSSGVVPTMRHASSSSGQYAILYAFKGKGDGAYPQSALAAANGVLYGTTSGQLDEATDYGTVFSITTAGAEHVLHRFRGGSDGSQPIAALAAINGVLYGSTYQGGAGYGTLFRVGADGSGYHILHRFGGTSKSDGAEPAGALLLVGQTLYGTTQRGGNTGNGTFFRMNIDGSGYKVLYSFAGIGARDAADPEGNLVRVNGLLYGTSYYGGTTRPASPAYGCGAVFTVTDSGTERVVYRFSANGRNDGANPVEAGLLWVNGLLYGTTSQNASSNCFSGTGCGAIFTVTTSGSEPVIHRFAPLGTADGATPEAGLIALNGTLYGSTLGGGTGGPGGGNGAVFETSPTGSESAIYSFGGPSVGDGAQPNGLIALGGALYGTAQIGGNVSCANANGCGVVFRIVP